MKSGNTDWLVRSRAAVWHPCTQMKQHETLPLVPIARAQGAWLTDFDGRRYLDAISSWWTNLFGHNHPALTAALRDQLDRLDHVMLAGFTHEPVVTLSERLSALAPGDLGHCFYASDGASAVEIALKMSMHYWRNTGQAEKTGFVSLEQSYHGETLGALAVTDVRMFRDTYAPLLQATHQTPVPDPRRRAAGQTAEEQLRLCIAALDTWLEQHHARTAALIVEPLVQCAAGMVMYGADFLRQLRQTCDRHGIHLIADEIAVGMGRTGSLFACEQAGIVPDFLCLSKGLTGGTLPLATVLSREAVYRAFYADDLTTAFLHSHSYTGNPLACRAALATLDLFEAGDVLAENRVRAARLDTLCAELRAHPRVEHFRRTGMIWAFDVRDAGAGFASRLFQHALEQHLLLRPIGSTVYFMPPYTLNEDEFSLLARGTLRALDLTLNEKDPCR